jgi:hypothetical protein
MQNGTPPSPPNDDVVPKVEEIEDVNMIGAKRESPPHDESEERTIMSHDAASGVVARRPRGRPRKHPKTLQITSSKHPKGRSKTGCITCRRRKKKCDETKPACLHCQKNNVHCEGYPPKDYWQSGKQRTVKGETSRLTVFENKISNHQAGRTMSIDRPRELPVLIDGIETDTDWFFFDHFNMHLSRVLSLFTERNNPFKGSVLHLDTKFQPAD